MTEREPLALSARSIAGRADAERLCAEIGGILDRLAPIVAEETRLVRAAQLRAATDLHDSKAELSRQYALALETLRSHAAIVGRYAPVLVEQLRRRHEAFRSELQVNMAVLATARSVSETLVRGVAEEVATRNSARTYGAAGAISATTRNAARPIAVSRSL
ncbi:hypothetical protein [Labrys wisconsinensis]|uniref:Flagellar protein FlgN n=1 Tax=Labrys wisconsinensis TaxID=425677 RepID=A0ABU0JIV7_9HYPH|nr:hypothetical protein [Labrys wisconsinensis]MDQ0473072.1 hypothetical protein [Labrys wisconsinensis]